MSKQEQITVTKTVYRTTDRESLQQAFQTMADIFTVKELEAIAKKLKSPVVQLQIRSML